MANKDLILSGRKEIEKFVDRPWNVIRKWINERGFPAAMIDGRWESDAEEIIAWRKKQIKTNKGSSQ